jgi:beta-N-acetylglucosaminidase
MHDRPRRLVAAGMTGLFLAAAIAIPADAGSPHPAQVRKAEPRRVVEYRPNRPFTHDTDLLSASGYAAWMIDELLLATTPLPRLGAAFTQAERDTGVNARYLVAHAILETGWGTSWIAQRKHNLFGHHAYDRGPLRYATRFPTFAAGIAAVSTEIRAAYLSPDGRWWRGFPTLRGVNRFYASDVLWADKVAVLANAIDGIIVTLRERGLHFGWPRIATPAPGAAVAASSLIVVEVPWASRTLGLPAAIRFAVRWMPVALAEGGPTALAGPSASTWTLVGRGTRAGHIVRLSVATPTVPGSWRLEIEARDSDGLPLPATDAPPIRPLALRVAAPTEATISVGLGVTPQVPEAGGACTAGFAVTPVPPLQAGELVATIRNVGRTTIPAIAQDGTPTLLEAWSLPLAADGDAVRLAGAPLLADLQPGAQVALHLPRPAGAAVVVLRLSGDPAAIGRSVPATVLFGPFATGGAMLTQLHVPDLRDASFVSPAPTTASAPTRAPAPVVMGPPVAGPPVPPSPGAASVSVMQADAPGEVAIGLVQAPTSTAPYIPAEPPAAPPWVLVRTLPTLFATTVDPTVAFHPWPGDRATDAPSTLRVAGVPAGVRLVIAALVPEGGSVADPATLRLAWVPVADPGTDPTPR